MGIQSGHINHNNYPVPAKLKPFFNSKKDIGVIQLYSADENWNNHIGTVGGCGEIHKIVYKSEAFENSFLNKKNNTIGVVNAIIEFYFSDIRGIIVSRIVNISIELNKCQYDCINESDDVILIGKIPFTII